MYRAIVYNGLDLTGVRMSAIWIAYLSKPIIPDFGPVLLQRNHADLEGVVWANIPCTIKCKLDYSLIALLEVLVSLYSGG